MVVLSRTVPVFGSVCTEFRRRGPLSLLHSDNSAEVSALTKLDSIIVYFPPLQFPTTPTLSNLIRNLCKHGKIDDLLEVFQILSIKGYFSDMARYNVMVSFLCKAGKVKEAFEVKKKGLCLDVSFYYYLMEACCREELLRHAKRLWDEMFASGCSGNLKTYNILIKKFSEKGQVEESQRLFSHMLEKGIVPDTMTYTSLLEGFVKRTRLKMLLKSSKSPLNMIPCQHKAY